VSGCGVVDLLLGAWLLKVAGFALGLACVAAGIVAGMAIERRRP